MFIQDNDKIQEALARLISQSQGSEKLKALLAAFVQPLQDAEAALTAMNTQRYLPNAVGAQLDIIGSIVGVARPTGASDAEYMTLINGQIKVNTSQGQPEQIIQTFQIYTGALIALLFEKFPASFLINSPYLPADQAEANKIFDILRQVSPAGVSASDIVAYDQGDSFAYAGSLEGQGYGSTLDPTVGGKYPVQFRHQSEFAYDGDDPTPDGYGSKFDPLVGGSYTS